MIHIAPWAATHGLMAGARGGCCRRAARLVLYGPYTRGRRSPIAASNAAFDADLRARDPAWGLRAREAVEACAAAAGLRPVRRFAMPANNLCLVFERH